MSKTLTSLRVPDEFLAVADAIAVDQKRTRSEVLIAAIETGLAAARVPAGSIGLVQSPDRAVVLLATDRSTEHAHAATAAAVAFQDSLASARPKRKLAIVH